LRAWKAPALRPGRSILPEISRIGKALRRTIRGIPAEAAIA
jgi:hypothetical protein